MDKHDATAKAAAIAALPGGTVTECETVERACRKLRRGKSDVGDGVIIVSPAKVAEAAERLPKKRK